MQLQVLLARFATQLKADGRSLNTQMQYARHGQLLLRWARRVRAPKRVERWRHQHLGRFLSSRLARTTPDSRPKREASVNALRSSIRTLFGYAHNAGFAPVNAAALVRRAICSPAPPRALSQEDEKRLLATLRRDHSPTGQRDRLLFELLLQSGIRLGSAVGLDVEDVDFGARELQLRSTKGSRETTVPIPCALLARLRSVTTHPGPGPLFRGRGGKRLSARHIQRRFATLVERAEIQQRATVHSLRHTYGQRTYRRTGDVLATMRAMRHRSVASTMVYMEARAANR